MLARRIIAVSSDKAFGKRLAVALKAAGGAVELHASVDALGAGPIQAALCVLHVEEPVAATAVLARLSGETRVIAVLPRTSLAAIVEVMQGSQRVAGMLVADDFDPRQLSAMATRVLAGDIFGAEKLVPWGTQVHSCLVGDYHEKSRCIAQVSEFAEAMGVRRKYRESIEQCLDEMLMNALYDAPVDERGEPIFADLPTKTRISLRVEQQAVVQYACDGGQFVVAVRDAFGTLERATVLRFLHKCLHHEQQIDRKAGGAGLGLYLMTNSASTVYFNVLPGIATEAVCTFDLEAPKLQLEGFGFFTERIDAAGRLAAGPSRRLPAGTSHPVERRAPRSAAAPRRVVGLLGAAIVATLVLVMIAAWPRLFGPGTTTVTIKTIPSGATIEVEGKNAGTARDGTLVVRDLEVGRAYPLEARLDGYEPRQVVVQPVDGDNALTLDLIPIAPTVSIESVPSGAHVEIGGTAVGVTPLALSNLAAGQPVELTFRKPGYQVAITRLDVPRPGKDLQLIQPLTISGDVARIRLISEPAGAQIVQNGQLLAGVTTPTDVLVEADKPVRFTLTMAGRVPVVIDPFTPGRGATNLVRSGSLVAGVTLQVGSNLDARVSVSPAPHCQRLSTPATCVLAPGAYDLELIAAPVNASGGRATRRVTLTDADVSERIEFGYVEAGPNQLIRLGSARVRRAALEVGPRRIMVSGNDGLARPVTVAVVAGATVTAN